MPVTSHPETPIRDVTDLRLHFAAGEKQGRERRLGVEHEKIGVLASGAAPAYDEGIRAVLEALRDGGLGWREISEDGLPIALAREGGASVSLEPGGQLELSDSPRHSAVEAQVALLAHLRELAGPASAQSLHFLGVGFRPFGTIDDVPWMPKGRYRVMRSYLPTRAARPHEMMKRTATVQVNLDYDDQADCAAKFRTSMGTSSLVTALWAASPIVDGRATDFQSYRADCWLETDDDRCGLLPFVFDPDSDERIYERYADWALDVPMFFVYRQGRYIPADGMSFRRFVVEGFGEERATNDDWELHLSTLFPEVRLKRYLEMRGADAGPIEMVTALPALYRGLLYDAEAQAAAWELVADLSWDERVALRRTVPKLGLRATVRGEAILGRCRELVRIAREGLRRLGADDDAALLAPIERIAAEGRSVADEIRDLHHRVAGDPRRMISALSIPLAG